MNRLREISFCHICLIVSVALAVAAAHSSGVFAEEPETRILRDRRIPQCYNEGRYLYLNSVWTERIVFLDDF